MEVCPCPLQCLSPLDQQLSTVNAGWAPLGGLDAPVGGSNRRKAQVLHFPHLSLGDSSGQLGRRSAELDCRLPTFLSSFKS